MLESSLALSNNRSTSSSDKKTGNFSCFFGSSNNSAGLFSITFSSCKKIKNCFKDEIFLDKVDTDEPLLYKNSMYFFKSMNTILSILSFFIKLKKLCKSFLYDIAVLFEYPFSTIKLFIKLSIFFLIILI